MNKQDEIQLVQKEIREAEQSLSRAKARLDEIQNRPESCESKLVGRDGCIIYQSVAGNWTYHGPNKKHFGILSTRKAANFTEGLDTFFELLACDGVEEPIDYKKQWYVCPYGQISLADHLDYKIGFHTAWFKTQKHAEDAREKIGAERIVKMYKQLNFIDV